MRLPTKSIRAGALVLCLTIAPVATACGGNDDAASTTSAAKTPATATTDPSTPTTAPSTTIGTSSLASGSGCTPGAGDLPDGEWFGFVADASGDGIEFDLACWFDGDAAIAATAEDGEESPPPNDYYVRNTNPALRTVPVAADAEVNWLSDVGSPASVMIDYADWLVARQDRGIELQPSVWITIADGEVAAIEEQYVP